MHSTRTAFLVSLVVIFLLATTGAAFADDSDPVAVVLDTSDSVVAEVQSRSEAADVYERTVLLSESPGLTLEYLYESHGTVPSPPNDPWFFKQWNFDRIGVPSAWNYADGRSASSEIVVAVLDSAINVTGFDSFCTPIVSSYDAILQVEGNAPLNVSAILDHGTHIAGTIAQCTDNGIGVTGIAPHAALMPVRVLFDDGSGTTSHLAGGIDWAVDHGAQIINLSLGSDCDAPWPACNDPVVDAAIQRASAAGVLLIASSGNSASQFVAYPASHPDVVAVGASDEADAVWFEAPDIGSNYGTELDLVAPGVQILQEATSYGNYGYFWATGSSMSAAHVSGAAALMLSVDPLLRPEAIMSILADTAIDIGAPGFDVLSGWGRLDALAAVETAIGPGLFDPPCASDRCETVASVDSGGQWALLQKLDFMPPITSFYYGDPGDMPFMGDWDGIGEATPGLYRQSDGFVYLRNSNTQGNAELEFFFGNPGDVPLVGDFNGDGFDTVSIWRPSEARVFIINELGEDGAGLGAAEFDFYFGNSGDTPFIGDFDGDGVDTIGLYRESTGFVYLTNSLATGNADLSFFFGNPGDKVLAGDWDGDGDDTVAVYRASAGRIYINLENAPGTADWSSSIGVFPWVISAGLRD
jgi:hypothetical protein